jgi:hypothetical protein
LGSYRADALLGCAGRLSAHAAEMMTLAGVAQSFRHGSLLLQRRAGWTACHEMVRQACYRQADAASAQRAASAPEAEPFRQAQGQAEFQADATTVNTLDGWRDMKIGVFAKRLAAAPAPAEPWHQRRLPAPAARFAFAAIEEIGVFSPRWRSWAERLGLTAQRLSVLGDGADWIWDHAALRFDDWVGTPDIFHAGAWLFKAAQAGCGEGTAAGRAG